MRRLLLALLLSSLALHASAATHTLTGRSGFYSITYDARQWSQADTAGRPSIELLLEHKSGNVHATAVAEARPIALGALRQLVIENARNAAPDLHVVSEAHRQVHGVDMLVLRMEGTSSGIPLTYYGEYWSGPAGTLQVVTFTQKRLFARYRADMRKLLDGVRVRK